MTKTIREFKMEVTHIAAVPRTETTSLGTGSSSGRVSFTIQAPTTPDQAQTARSSSAEALSQKR
jgi:hypothetical protein